MKTKNWNFCTMWCMNTKIRKICVSTSKKQFFHSSTSILFMNNNQIIIIFIFQTLLKFWLLSLIKFVIIQLFRENAKKVPLEVRLSLSDDIFVIIYVYISFVCLSAWEQIKLSIYLGLVLGTDKVIYLSRARKLDWEQIKLSIYLGLVSQIGNR